MQYILDRLDTWQARLATGLAMLGALAAFLAPKSGWVADPGKGTALAIAVIAWLVVTLRGASTPHPHDITLFSQVMEAVTQPERALLRTQDFLDDFKLNEIGGVRAIADTWDGPTYCFLDLKIQRRWLSLKTKIDEFSRLVALTTVPHPINPQFQTAKLIIDIRLGMISQKSRDDAKNLNDCATELSALMDDFEPFSRRRLRV